MIHWREGSQKHQFVIPKSFVFESDCYRVYRVHQGTGYNNVLQSIGLYWGILVWEGVQGVLCLLQGTGGTLGSGGTVGYWGARGYWEVIGGPGGDSRLLQGLRLLRGTWGYSGY